MVNALFYSNLAQPTTLAGNITSGATSMTVAAPTGFPGSFPYVLAVDHGAASEELVLVTNASGATLTVTRGYGGTSAQSHSSGADVLHVANAQDLTDFRSHEAAATDVHGVTGALVGATSTQTLSNKTLTTPTINSGGALSGTFTGNPAFSGTPTFSGAVTLSGGGALSGTFTGSPTFSGTPSFTGGASLSGTVSGSPTLTGAPTFSGAALFTGNPIIQGATASAVAARVRVSGDASPRLEVLADGKHQWGPGTGATDTDLSRTGVGALGTSGNFAATGTLSAGAGKFAVDSTGTLTTYANNDFGTYTPTVANAGGATWTTRTGWYVKVGKMVFVSIYLVVNGAGSGTNPVTVTTPSNPERTIRQTMLVGANGAYASGIFSTGHMLAFQGGSGAAWDRIRASNTNADNRDGDLEGGHLLSGAVINIQGWYREA